MRTLHLQQDFSVDFTAIPNIFFDFYMPRANGEFVKIYLYIARCLNRRDKAVSIDLLADAFNHTEADVMRALRYWNNQGLIEFVYSEDGRDLTGLRLIFPKEPSASDSPLTNSDGGGFGRAPRELPRDAAAEVPGKTSFSATQIRQLEEQDEIKELFFLAERYLNRLLNPKDREALLYLYVDLQFTVDLIVHLLEYCTSNNHASIRYIEKVAQNWHSAGVRTIKEAKEQVSQYNSSALSVMKAFGIAGRCLGQSEQDFIAKWNKEYCFTDDMIAEACNRALQRTHEPNFKYADSILGAWREKNIFTLEDLEKSDRDYASAKAVQGKGQRVAQGQSANARQNYIQRDYDFEQLEQMLMDNNK